ncbi:hypothetical protein DRQ07_02560 [candidate division KSB1 bacterium]|nr:MAG: hypothetical protein DRQ07_02560 [candidate division KSB1 bacterium]
MILIIAFFSSAYFSGTETALISVSRVKLEIWIKRGIKSAGKIYTLLNDIEHVLITTLVGTNIAVIAASSLMTFYLEKVMNGFWIVAVSSSILLIFGEIIPKTFARDRAANILRYTVYIFVVFKYLFYPITVLINWLSSRLLKSIKFEAEKKETILTRQYLDSLVKQGSVTGTINKTDSSLISRFLLSGNMKVGKIMVPRTEVEIIKINDSVSSVIKKFNNTGLSRLPVIKDSIDDIAGIVFAKDIIIRRPAEIKEILRDPYFVPETSTLLDVFKQMQLRKESAAIVVDEYGGVEGFVTMEDIVEEFLGDIYDEFDEDEFLFRNIKKDSIEVKAKIEIDELNEKFSFNLPVGEYQSLGGLLMAKAGKIPKRGEEIDLESCTVKVISGSRKKINWVRIKRKKKSILSEEKN